MKIPQSVMDSLQDQFNQERQNSAWYRAQGDALDARSWPGSKSWFRRQAKDENCHAKTFAEFIEKAGGEAEYRALEPSPALTGEILAPFYQQALLVEQANTEAIKTIYYLAEQEEDPFTKQFIHKFLKIQLEEERIVEEIVLLLTRAGNDYAALLHLDHKFGKGSHYK
jgi:ferritin